MSGVVIVLVIDSLYFRANGSFDDLDIAHLTQFSINSNINLPVIELVNITFHNISFVGKYDLFGVVGQLFDIYGNGSFW